jgi:hypothetical protein
MWSLCEFANLDYSAFHSRREANNSCPVADDIILFWTAAPWDEILMLADLYAPQGPNGHILFIDM